MKAVVVPRGRDIEYDPENAKLWSDARQSWTHIDQSPELKPYMKFARLMRAGVNTMFRVDGHKIISVCDDGDEYVLPINLIHKPSSKFDPLTNQSEGNEMPSYYNKYITVNINESHKKEGKIRIKLDPYRIAQIFDVRGGAMEQIMKKALRGTGKGHGVMQVYTEIIQAAQRGIEMEEEDIEA